MEATQYTLNGTDIKDPIYNQTTGDFFIEDNVRDNEVERKRQRRFDQARLGKVQDYRRIANDYP